MMLKRILHSFLQALQNIRSNLFYTFLSVLGIVIGVAALVSILSLIDGMEKFAKDQIATTTSLNMINISTNPNKNIDGISVRKDSVPHLTYLDFQKLQARLTRPAKTCLVQRVAHELSIDQDTAGTAGYAIGVAGFESDSILAGRALQQEDLANRLEVCVLTKSLARQLVGDREFNELLRKILIVERRKLEIIGVVQLTYSRGPELFFPFTLLTSGELKRNLPQCLVEAKSVEDVSALKEEIKGFLVERFSDTNDFSILTNELRVVQATKAFQLFRIIMGLIVGISVIVGGVGVMNVLLISVTERTTEIGIRKAVGANRRDIVLLFLSESITVSAFGSLLGLIFGTAFAMAAIPIVKAITQVPFQAEYTWNTFFVITAVAILVGIVFGTYPAMRASRLNPVEAIRHE